MAEHREQTDRQVHKKASRQLEGIGEPAAEHRTGDRPNHDPAPHSAIACPVPFSRGLMSRSTAARVAPARAADALEDAEDRPSC